MTSLRFMRISNIQFPNGLLSLSNDLRILEWYGCSLKSLPSSFLPKQIYEVDMRSSQLVELWQKDIVMPNLSSMCLSFSKYLTKIPNLTSTPKLVKLNLEGCTSLKEVHESVLLHRTLVYLNLKGCTCLKSLGRSKMEMEALEELVLSGCSNLECIPEFGQNMKRLEHLYVDGTKIKKLPDTLGEMHDLRKLDVSGTLIKELPSSIHHLKRLRLLCGHRCRFFSPTQGFLCTNLDTLSSGLRELDLSYCSLSIIPDGIGLLYRLTKLDLSGNDFVMLPESISLLSNLTILCLNDCKRLQSLPKLPIINEDTIRFRYSISGKGLDVSKIQPTSDSRSPTISCLNCPMLVENQSCSGVADTVLKNYLQLRGRTWVIPEATFEIVGVGIKISQWFELGRFDSMVLRGTWIGVAICAVVAFCHPIDSFQEIKHEEIKHEVIAHIRTRGKHWKIPIRMNFVDPKLETQLIWYWTIADDLQRGIDPAQHNEFDLSFSVEPEDNELLVMDVGVRFIRETDILEGKQDEVSTTGVMKVLFEATSCLPNDLERYIGDCAANPELQYFNSILQEQNSMITNLLTVNSDKSYISLNSLHEVLSPIKITQEVLKVILQFKEEIRREKQLSCLVFHYNEFSLRISELYADFVGLLKSTHDGWLNVQLSMLQIEVKRRAGDLNYVESLEQLNDLETTTSARFSEMFITTFESLCEQKVAILRYFSDQIQPNVELKSGMAWERISSVIIAGAFSVLSTWVVWILCSHEQLRKMNVTDSDTLSYLIQWCFKSCIGNKVDTLERWDSWHPHDRRLTIMDFDKTAILLRRVKYKMAQARTFTIEDEDELMSLVNHTKEKIAICSKTLEDMSRDACTYGIGIRKATDDFTMGVKRAELTAVPIFYHVNPPDVQHHKRSSADAFRKHEKDPAIVHEMMETLSNYVSMSFHM